MPKHLQNELFLSTVTDSNDLDTVLGRCTVVTYAEFEERRAAGNADVHFCRQLFNAKTAELTALQDGQVTRPARPKPFCVFPLNMRILLPVRRFCGRRVQRRVRAAKAAQAKATLPTTVGLRRRQALAARIEPRRGSGASADRMSGGTTFRTIVNPTSTRSGWLTLYSDQIPWSQPTPTPIQSDHALHSAVHSSVRPSVRLSVRPSVCPSVCPS